ncbi:MAG: hypothetical protein IPJ98_09925 [Bryobacterales bacterium]|nr:hypothetical protein [Bryobacterales bacterium]
MGNLFATMGSAARSLKAFESALGVASNNITNAQTPGFARQSLTLLAQRMVPEMGLPGGVAAGDLLSSRKAYLEQGVRLQLGREGITRSRRSTWSRPNRFSILRPPRGWRELWTGCSRPFPNFR